MGNLTDSAFATALAAVLELQQEMVDFSHVGLVCEGLGRVVTHLLVALWRSGEEEFP